MTDSLTNDERMALLTQAGVTADDAHELVLGAQPTVIAEATYDVTLDPISPDFDIRTFTPQVHESDFDFEATLKRVIGKAYADKDKALSLCDEHGKTYFDTLKMSKVQAAARGVDKTAHNKRVWDDSQKITTTLKRMVRDHYRVGSVKAKIAASKAALPQEVRNLNDDALERLLASEEFLALARKMESTD